MAQHYFYNNGELSNAGSSGHSHGNSDGLGFSADGDYYACFENSSPGAYAHGQDLSYGDHTLFPPAVAFNGLQQGIRTTPFPATFTEMNFETQGYYSGLENQAV
jgi:hypothetical protein